MTGQDVTTPGDVWKRLGEIKYELDTAEMNAERLEDSTTPERVPYWWRRAAELREEFDTYAAKHRIQLDEDEEIDR